jgi:hypothetical protein
LSLKRGDERSVSEAYKKYIRDYVEGLQVEEHYLKTVANLHNYFTKQAAYSSVILIDFQDKFLRTLIPAEFYSGFSNKEKDNVLHTVIVRAATELSSFVNEQANFRMIVDNHERAQEMILQMQNEMIDCFAFLQEEYHSRFYKASNSSEMVPKDVFKNLKKEYVEKMRAILVLEENNARAVNMIQGLMSKLKSAESEIAKLRRELNDAVDELGQVKYKLKTATESKQQASIEDMISKPQATTEDVISKSQTYSPQTMIRKPAVDSDEELDDAALYALQQQKLLSRTPSARKNVKDVEHCGLPFEVHNGDTPRQVAVIASSRGLEKGTN